MPPVDQGGITELSARLSAVLESTADLNNLLSKEESLYPALLERLRQAVSFDSGSVQLFDGTVLYIAAFLGTLDPDIVAGLRFPPDPLLPNYRVVQDAAPHVIADTHVEYPHFKTREEEFSSGHIRSWLGVPLLVDGVVTGMIALDRNKVDPFSAMDIRVAQAFANHAAVAIRNAQLYEELESALAAKDALMRELHHRVKNNLQLITSLISIHQNTLEDPGAQRNLAELRLRVGSIATVHERLYQSAEVEAVDLGQYLREVSQEISDTYRSPDLALGLKTAFEPLHTNLRSAVPLGLVLSEVIINAAKHAFAGRRAGTIRISLTREGPRGILVIADDGAGISEREERREGFGLHLISSLAEQIKGTARISSGPDGVRWTIVFPVDPAMQVP